MTIYNDFKRSVLGKAFDIDGWYGAQCWDGYAKYCRWLGYPYASCTTTGYVQDIWTNRSKNGMLTHFTEVSVMQPGDVAVFKKHPATPFSHIAIFDSDAGGGYGWFLGQNQGAANGAFNLVKIPYAATYDTAFRPKVLTAQTPSGEVVEHTWDINAKLKVGDVVKSKSCAIQGIVGNCVRCNELGGLVPLADVNEAPDTRDGACDNYLATTNARIELAESIVQAVDTQTNRAKVNGYWVNAGPLMAKR